MNYKPDRKQVKASVKLSLTYINKALGNNFRITKGFVENDSTVLLNWASLESLSDKLNYIVLGIRMTKKDWN
jgi:hypothetical protein